VRVAVLGLGEAGWLYAGGLAARGATVIAFDPAVSTAPAGVAVSSDAEEAVRAADVVASLVGASAAHAVGVAAFPAMRPAAVYADMNTAAPDDKRALAAEAAGADVLFADVAIMAPVPRAAELTPLLVSGSGAELLAAEWGPLGIPLTSAGPDAGTAAGLKLLRSVFMKGLAALVFESVSAADRLDAGDWIRAEIAAELGSEGSALVERLLTGTRQHAERRTHEMEDVAAFLATLGTPAWMTDSTLRWLRAIAADEI
jgi:3-hydroxyisobutyrate dehydrogenase-like beta-hydroxyacid dehydrogenase